MSGRRAILRSVIGKPYSVGGEGPESFDCYGLARFVLREAYGIELPSSRFAPVARRAWRRLTTPADGALVLMGVQDKHVGVFVAGGFLHATSGTGVVFDDLLSLRFRGLGKIRMYLPA
jgi:cell wall-associated NlpC family hydrolase